MTRILVAGSAYVHQEGLRELAILWKRVVEHLDPGVDIVVLDSVSPFSPATFLGWPEISEKEDQPTGDMEMFLNLKSGNTDNKPLRWVYKFRENIGHLSRGGEDGAGRTFCRSIELGIAGGYDYVAIIETDLIFLRSVTEIVERLKNSGTHIAAVPNHQYQFPEFGVTFVDCKWAKQVDFVGQYDWKRSQPWPIPEIRIMNIVRDELMLLPLYGMRVDQMAVRADNLPNFFPYYPPAWITHAASIDVYMKAIMLNGIQLK